MREDHADEKLIGVQVAAILGIQVKTWNSYVSRRQAPPPDGRWSPRRPWWWRSTIERYRTTRRQGRRTDLERVPKTRKPGQALAQPAPARIDTTEGEIDAQQA